MMDPRKEYAYRQVTDKNARILEIGPLNRPIFDKQDYPNCFTADIRSTDEVKALYGFQNNYLKATGIQVDTSTIVDIDYVIKGTYAETFASEEKFDCIVASHVLEHIPNLLGWFKQAFEVLKDDGKIILVYPDKRYCFDHFRTTSTFLQAWRVYQGDRPTEKDRILDFTTNVVAENDPRYWWDGHDGLIYLSTQPFDPENQDMENDDTHYWPFSPEGFLRFLYDMERAGQSDYVCADFEDTRMYDQQFFVTLKKKRGSENRAAILSQLKMFMRQCQENEPYIMRVLNASVQQHQTQLAEVANMLQSLQVQLAEISKELLGKLRQMEALLVQSKAECQSKNDENARLSQELEQMIQTLDKIKETLPEANFHTGAQP